MTDERKISGYIVKNQRPEYQSAKEKESAEQAVIKKVLREYNKLEREVGKKSIS